MVLTHRPPDEIELDQRARRMEQLKVPAENSDYANFDEGYLEMDEENDIGTADEYEEADDDEI